MNELRRLAVAVLSGAILAGAMWIPTSAEVAVSISSNGFQVVSYVMEGIVDDPEPVGNAWRRFNADGAHRAVLNDEGFANGDGDPALVVHSGVPIVAWSKSYPGGYDVVISRFVDGSWSVPQPVADSAADELDPHLVLDSQGSIHLLYWINDGSPRVMHMQGPADLTSWSAAIQVSQPAEIACRPSGAFHDGVLRVAYEVHDFGYGSTPRQIVVATRQAEGFGSQTLAVTQHAGDNRPVLHDAGGTLWVDWIDADGEMAWRRQLSSGVWQPIEIEPFETNEERDYHVRGAIRVLALQ